MTAARPHDRGFALLEVLLATAIALLALVVVTRLHIALVRAERLAEERSIAALFAEERAESLLSRTRAALEAPADGSDAPEEPSGAGAVYTRSWSAAAPSRDAIGFEVRVRWPAEAPLHEVRLFAASTLGAAIESGHAAIAPASVPPPLQGRPD
jgi:prepilin-type N-terminal cleavage/methylation domain-containing protein